MKKNKKILIKNICIVNEGKSFKGNVVIEKDIIKDIVSDYQIFRDENFDLVIDGENKILIPGIIDTHVHFREPGLTYKGNIYTESRAALAGGITSFFDMPNTIPPAISMKEIENKINIAKNKSFINYAFYIGATDNNLEEICAADYSIIPGIKIFLGSSTGNLKISNEKVIEKIFSLKNIHILAHCEDDSVINKNLNFFKNKYSDDLFPYVHKLIRSEEACVKSTIHAINLAKKYNSMLHILHVSTAKEVSIIEKEKLRNDFLTAEACIPHIYFTDKDYESLGNKIKCNPSIKTDIDRNSIIDGLKKGIVDTIATDHAPHTLAEKELPYLSAPSGIPSIQFSLLLMLEMVHQKIFTLEEIVEKMAHNPSRIFGIKNRGFIRKGYFADLVIIDFNKKHSFKESDILSLCKWSPFAGHIFSSSIEYTFVNGTILYDNGKIIDNVNNSMLIEFKR